MSEEYIYFDIETTGLPLDSEIIQVSISPTFYKQLFRRKAFLKAFLYF